MAAQERRGERSTAHPPACNRLIDRSIDGSLPTSSSRFHPSTPPTPASYPHRAGIMDELASQYGFSYQVAKADIDERAIRHDDPHALVLLLAHAKAAAIRQRLQQQQQQQSIAAGDGGGGVGVGGEGEGVGLRGLLVTCDQVRGANCVGGWLCVSVGAAACLGAAAPTWRAVLSLPQNLAAGLCFLAYFVLPPHPPPPWSNTHTRTLTHTQVVLHEGRILEKPEDERQVGGVEWIGVGGWVGE